MFPGEQSNEEAPPHTGSGARSSENSREFSIMNSHQGMDMAVVPSHGPQMILVTNRLLDHLSPKLQSELLAIGELVELQAGEVLCETHDNFTHVYFPLTAFISMLGEISGHPAMEMSLIGNEGMVGTTLGLGIKTAPQQAVVQGSGTALRMSLNRFQGLMRANPPLTTLLGRYLYVLIVQMTQATACISFHPVETRLTRWLLMTHDRAHADHFHITHQLLADLLGVQRSAVTIAAGLLQDKGLISYSRGDIKVLDRKGLERNCCECYSALTSAYQRFEAGR